MITYLELSTKLSYTKDKVLLSQSLFIFQTTRKHQSTEKSDKSKFQYTQSTCEYCLNGWWFGSAQQTGSIAAWSSDCTHYSQTSTAKYASIAPLIHMITCPGLYITKQKLYFIFIHHFSHLHIFRHHRFLERVADVTQTDSYQCSSDQLTCLWVQ